MVIVITVKEELIKKEGALVVSEILDPESPGLLQVPGYHFNNPEKRDEHTFTLQKYADDKIKVIDNGTDPEQKKQSNDSKVDG